MEKRIELEKRGRCPSTIEELNLDNCKSASILGLSEDWTNLKYLSLINVGLTSLKAFPRLSSLSRLELSDNWISGGLEALSSLPELLYLNLSGNKISDIDTLQPLKTISTLVNLDLFNCDVFNCDGYRQKVFDLIPSLNYLDGFDKEGNEIKDEDDMGEKKTAPALSTAATSTIASNSTADGKFNSNNKCEPEVHDVDDDDDDLDDEDIDDEEVDDDDDDDLDDSDEDDDDIEEVPLDAIYKNYDPEGDGDYEAVEDGEEEEIEEEEDDNNASHTNSSTNNTEENGGGGGGGRGKKRKHEAEEQ